MNMHALQSLMSEKVIKVPTMNKFISKFNKGKHTRFYHCQAPNFSTAAEIAKDSKAMAGWEYVATQAA